MNAPMMLWCGIPGCWPHRAAIALEMPGVTLDRRGGFSGLRIPVAPGRPRFRARGLIDNGERDMKRGHEDATREALGCFCMLILGAIMTLGGLVIILPGLVAALTGKPPAGLWRSAFIWLAAPAIGIAVVASLTYGFRRPGDRSRRS